MSVDIYKEGKPCVKCGKTLRYKKRGNCVACKKQRTLATKEKRKVNARKYNIQKLYGLTPDDFDFIFSNQAGACAICQEPFISIPHIDHDHKTGVVRGLLCRSCNLGIGSLKDDPERCRRASVYLKTHCYKP